MNINLILGVILLIVAGVLLYFGYNASQSVGEQIHETFTGRFTDSTIWYFVFGFGSALGGVILLALRNRA